MATISTTAPGAGQTGGWAPWACSLRTGVDPWLRRRLVRGHVISLYLEVVTPARPAPQGHSDNQGARVCVDGLATRNSLQIGNQNLFLV